MQVLQLDSVNRVARTHFFPMFSRLGAYDMAKLDKWLWWSGENHEYLSHEASMTSMQLRPLLAHRFDRDRWSRQTIEEEEPGYVQAVLAEVAENGPLSVSDLSDPGERSGPWWGNPKGKTALEWLYSSGRLSIRDRSGNFVTQYDLPNRVVPDHILHAEPVPEREAERELLLLGARAHGVGTATDIADYFRIKMPNARPLLKELEAEGRLIPAEVQGWKDRAYLHPEAKRPRAINACTLLTPFDPVVWFRPRAERLFGFHYRIEIYVPEPKRIYGYYVLPFLLGDELVGRVDVKADRKAGVLHAFACFAEETAAHDHVAENMATALQGLSDFLGLQGVEVGRKGNIAAGVRRAC